MKMNIIEKVIEKKMMAYTDKLLQSCYKLYIQDTNNKCIEYEDYKIKVLNNLKGSEKQ